MEALGQMSDVLLLELSRRDPRAFGVFYERHAPEILSFTVRRAGSTEAGAELMAEVFAAALHGAGSYRPAHGPAIGWVFGIARHKLADFHRAGYVEYESRRRLGMPRRGVEDEDLDRVEQLASLHVSSAALDEALDELSAEQRDALVARVVDEKPYAQIGAETDVAPTVVRQRVSRGLAALRNRLGSTDD